MKDSSIKLKPKDIKFLKNFKQTNKRSLREINRANILLLLHKCKQSMEIAEFLDVGRNTVSRTKQKYLLEGMLAALEEEERPGQPIKYTSKHEAELIALACSNAPSGRTRWTLELLTEKLKMQSGFETINRETIRLMLKKNNVNLG
jgi:putative transposase